MTTMLRYVEHFGNGCGGPTIENDLDAFSVFGRVHPAFLGKGRP
jgi:hypothetical protein